MRRLASWLPPLGWMALVLWLSGDSFSAEETGSVTEPVLHWLLPWTTPATREALHWGLRKLAHVIEYAILAGLWLRALRREGAPVRPATWGALLVAIAWAMIDEGRQSAATSRSGSAGDVALDGAGATLALVLARRNWRRIVDGATTALLWTTCAGGALAIVVNVLAGAPTTTLWITTPAAALLLILRRRSGATPSARRVAPATDDRPPP